MGQLCIFPVAKASYVYQHQLSANHPSSISVNCKSFWLTYYFSLYVEKLFPSSAAAPSMCHQTFLTVVRGVKICYFLWPGRIRSVTNWSQPVLYEKKNPNTLFLCCLGPDTNTISDQIEGPDVFYQRYRMCSTCETQESPVSFAWTEVVLEHQRWGTGARMKKLPICA